MLGTQLQSDYFEAPDNTPTVESIDRSKPCWIVFVGNVLPPAFTETFAGMSMGGENLGQDFKTLSLTKGLLRRCQLTPMTIGQDFLNADTLGDDKSKVKSRTYYNEDVRRNETQYYVECLPGDELESVLSELGNMGVREVKSLRGQEPTNGGSPSLASTYQRRIFPEWDEYLAGKPMFPTLAGLERHLEQARTANPDLSDIIATMLDSAAQYRRWGMAYLDRLARLVKAAPTEGGQVYGWTPLAHALFDQLELNREEFLMKKTTDNSSDVRSELAEMQRQFAAILPAIGILAQQAAKKTEKAVESADEPGVKIGDKITLNGKSGTVAAKRFGRVKVEFEDGTETEVPSAELKAK